MTKRTVVKVLYTHTSPAYRLKTLKIAHPEHSPLLVAYIPFEQGTCHPGNERGNLDSKLQGRIKSEPKRDRHENTRRWGGATRKNENKAMTNNIFSSCGGAPNLERSASGTRV